MTDKYKIFIINSAEMGERIDKILSLRFPEYSRNYFLSLIKNSKVLVNNKSIKPSYLGKVGDNIEIEFIEKRIEETKGEKIDLNIIFENDDVLVINKQPGIVVHPAAGHSGGTLVNAIINHFPAIKDVVYDKNNEISKMRPGLVHRLDKDTSGVIIVAKNAKSLHSLSRQIQNHSAKKTYNAICFGWPKKNCGALVNYLGRHPKNRKKIAEIGKIKGKEAISNYSLIKNFESPLGKFSLIEFVIETGRTHQIRVQAANMGNPVLGDDFYGNKSSEMLSHKMNIKRQLLHAKTLEIKLPGDNKAIIFEAPLPEDFQKVLKN
jgi:23S rRNA pseudouridine1911/1915/1917 synthase